MLYMPCIVFSLFVRLCRWPGRGGPKNFTLFSGWLRDHSTSPGRRPEAGCDLGGGLWRSSCDSLIIIIYIDVSGYNYIKSVLTILKPPSAPSGPRGAFGPRGRYFKCIILQLYFTALIPEAFNSLHYSISMH